MSVVRPRGKMFCLIGRLALCSRWLYDAFHSAWWYNLFETGRGQTTTLVQLCATPFFHVALVAPSVSGAALALVDIVDERLKEVVAEVRATYGVPAHAFVADVTKEESVAEMVAGVKRQFGRIDCLFNNAGYQGLFAPVDTYSFEDFEKVRRWVGLGGKDPRGGGVASVLRADVALF